MILSVSKVKRIMMYLLDTNIISEIRKGQRADRGVQTFFKQVQENKSAVYLSSITIGELRRGIEKLRYRHDNHQAKQLDIWLNTILYDYQDNILGFDAEAAQIWGYLRVPHHEHLIDKQIAAIALVHNLTVVTRNIRDFHATGVDLLNPFSQH